MHINTGKALKGLLIFGGLYSLVESFLHLSGIRLTGIGTVWPQSAVVYTELTEKILGATLLFIAVFLFEMSKDISRHKNFVKLSAVWSLFFGGLLIFLALSNNYMKVFKGTSSLNVWIPFYNQYVILEGFALVCYSILVYFWIKQKK